MLLGGFAAVPDPPQPLIQAGVFTATPSVLSSSRLLGPSVSARTEGPWSLGLRARLGAASADDLSWHVAHTELHLAAIGSYARSIGRGEVGLSLSAGFIALREHRIRHQAARLARAGEVPETSGWASGAIAGVEASVRLFVYQGWGVVLEGGPNLAAVAGSAARLGFSAGFSIAYAFGGPAL